MGMYTQINLSCTVKPEYRSESDCFINGNWANSSVKEFSEFGRKYGHADWISFHANNNCFYLTYDNVFDPDTGHLELSCAFKNYDNTTKGFHEIIPIFVESLDELEEISEQPWGLLYEIYNINGGSVVRIHSEGGNI